MRFLFGGDLMLGRGVAEVIRREGPEYPLASIAALTREADAFFVNLECALSPLDRAFSGAPKTFYFRADPEAAAALTHAGVDAVSLANNHALDADYEGLLDTLSILRDHDVACAGAGENDGDAGRPIRLGVSGRSVGLIAYCDHQPDFAARPDRPGIRFADVRRRDHRRAALDEVSEVAKGVDLLIVSFHWQSNWARRIERRFRDLARRLVEGGAHVVWGHSPHHFQGVEWIGRSVVLYSTGDLVDDYAVDATFRNDRQLLFEVTVGQTGVEAVRALPLELEYARTRRAHGSARRWIAERFGAMCRDVGSLVDDEGEWLRVRPA